MEEDKKKLEREIAVLKQTRDSLAVEVEEYISTLTAAADGQPTIQEQLNSKVESISDFINILSTRIENIDRMYSELLDPIDGNDKSVLEEVVETRSDVLASKADIDRAKKSIAEFKQELLGDEENDVMGLKQKFEKYEVEIALKQKKWAESQRILSEKIEGLLPGATATGLAKAYQDQRKSYESPYKIWAVVFVLTMAGMICFALINLKDVKDFNEAFMIMVSRLPFFIPAIWLAIFASKQQSQNKRLQQEYAYKETLTKSYEADKREIENLPDSEEKEVLSAKLLAIMIEMAKENPSATLQSNSHNDGPPSVLDLFKMKILKKLQGGE